jgi:hypothetical protein
MVKTVGTNDGVGADWSERDISESETNEVSSLPSRRVNSDERSETDWFGEGNTKTASRVETVEDL